MFVASSLRHDHGQVEREGERDVEMEFVKFLLEVDGVSVQFDIQERCTDLILKVTAVDTNLHSRREAKQNQKPMALGGGGGGGGVWEPYLSSEKILSMSSRGSALPPQLSQILTHSSPAGE